MTLNDYQKAALGLSLESVAKMNLQKLASRTKRGTLAGAGDHR